MVHERRDSARHVASLPAQIETTSGQYTIAVTRDLSSTGLLVLSHQALQVGSDVTLHIALAKRQYVVRGKVVRHEVVSNEDTALWRSAAAVAVDADDEGDLATILAAVAG